MAASLAASVFPDWDVLPGLAWGYQAAHFHRGASHSPIGVLLQAALMTPVGIAFWNWLASRFPRSGLLPAPPPRLLFLVLLAGMALHALADALNPWGVAPWWPFRRDGATWNLVHEGDLVYLALAACCAAVALFANARTILLVTAVVFGGFFVWKADRLADAHRIVARELGAEALVYPTPAPDCPWTALKREGGALRAACVQPGGDDELRIVSTVHSAESPLVEASKADPAVADFLAKRSFPFAEIEETQDARTVVLWRDLRETLLEGPGDPRFGIAVTFDEKGRIVSVEHRWLLKVSF